MRYSLVLIIERAAIYVTFYEDLNDFFIGNYDRAKKLASNPSQAWDVLLPSLYNEARTISKLELLRKISKKAISSGQEKVNERFIDFIIKSTDEKIKNGLSIDEEAFLRTFRNKNLLISGKDADGSFSGDLVLSFNVRVVNDVTHDKNQIVLNPLIP